MFYNNIFTLIKLRHAELLASSEVARLLEKSREELLAKAEQISLQADDENRRSQVYTIAHGQGACVLKTPHTSQLVSAAKDEDRTVDALEDAIFFKKSIF
ncbi:MAG: hypothetical protein FVQ83_12775 [Chloroflexi bacterium]|nr:hypothetical protein [Chloroflexota bacterium]